MVDLLGKKPQSYTISGGDAFGVNMHFSLFIKYKIEATFLELHSFGLKELACTVLDCLFKLVQTL